MKNLILLLLPLTLLGQGNIGVTVAQDVRLATMKDSNGKNSPFTTDVIFRVDLQGNQNKYGYLIVGAEYEYADLKGSAYNRYSFNIGYAFNEFKMLGTDKFDLITLLNFGKTIRTVTEYNRTTNPGFEGFAGSFTLGYPISDTGLKVVAIAQFSHRVDKNTLYGNDANYTFDFIKTDFSGFIGIQYDFKLKDIRPF